MRQLEGEFQVEHRRTQNAIREGNHAVFRVSVSLGGRIHVDNTLVQIDQPELGDPVPGVKRKLAAFIAAAGRI